MKTATSTKFVLDLVNVDLSNESAYDVAMRVIGYRSLLKAKQPSPLPRPGCGGIDEVADAAAYVWFLLARALTPHKITAATHKTAKRHYRAWAEDLARKILAVAEPLRATA